MSRHLNRRRFLQATAAASASALVPQLHAQEVKAPPSERLRIGVIGVAGQGEYNWGQLAQVKTAEVVALCDVDETRTAKARQKFPNAPFYNDYRKLLDAKGLDAVLVATPDHNHAVITAAALKAGLHTYCEKPLTHTVVEARTIAELAKKHKRVTQMGTQIHAHDNYRRVVELVQAGALGNVAEVHVWVGKSWGGHGLPKDKPAVPKTLNYDSWLGPVAYRPYSPAYMPAEWRRYWAFGGGTLADMACHFCDLPFWALKLRHPSAVSATGDPTPADAEGAAMGLVVNYEFPARDGMPAVKLNWYDGGKRPAILEEKKLPKWGDGVLFVGDKGMLLANYDKRVFFPDELKDITIPTSLKIPNSIGHHREWVEACRNGGTTTCNFDYSGALTEAVLLGNVAYRSGKAIKWDAVALKTGAAAADALLHTEYREGWSL